MKPSRKRFNNEILDNESVIAPPAAQAAATAAMARQPTSLHPANSNKTATKTNNIISPADLETLKQHYTFVPENNNDIDDKTNDELSLKKSWQDRMVEHYHNGLYKEFAIVDLTIPNKIGLRWRTKHEVMNAKGDHFCGNKDCTNTSVTTLEVPFSYHEHGVQKKELVKLKLCSDCLSLVMVASNNNNNGNNDTKQSSSLSSLSSKNKSTNNNDKKYHNDKNRKQQSPDNDNNNAELDLHSTNTSSSEDSSDKRRKKHRKKHKRRRHHGDRKHRSKRSRR